MSIVELKKELVKILNDIAIYQKEIAICHDYYLALESEIENKKGKHLNPQDDLTFTREIEELNKEYEEKSDGFFLELNPILAKGYEIAKKIGNEIAHDYKLFWDYMTNPFRKEVDFERVMRDIEYIQNLCK